MPDKKTNVILMNYPEYETPPNIIKIGTWTEQQKMDFLNAIREHTAEDYIDPCSFNIHFDNSVIHARNFDSPKLFTPHRQKIKPNELIVEVIPNIEFSECWAACARACPKCIQNGECRSWFMREYICKMLFPNKYAKQR